MTHREKHSEESTPVVHTAQHPGQIPRTDVNAPSSVLWQASSVRVPPVLGCPAGVLRIQQLKGNRAVSEMIAVQQSAEAGLREPSDEEIHSAAAEGIRTPATTLPFLDRIQASFGRHSVSHVKAHVGPEAAHASRALSALAFASGDHVVFGSTPDLRTAAHETAHVVQQQAGVQLAGGIGREGDAYERNADAVADAVVAGRSAEGLLEPFTALPGPSAEVSAREWISKSMAPAAAAAAAAVAIQNTIDSQREDTLLGGTGITIQRMYRIKPPKERVEAKVEVIEKQKGELKIPKEKGAIHEKVKHYFCKNPALYKDIENMEKETVLTFEKINQMEVKYLGVGAVVTADATERTLQAWETDLRREESQRNALRQERQEYIRTSIQSMDIEPLPTSRNHANELGIIDLDNWVRDRLRQNAGDITYSLEEDRYFLRFTTLLGHQGDIIFRLTNNKAEVFHVW